MRLKLISNGTSLSTKVVNAETGEPLEGIESIQWEVDARDRVSRMTLNFINIPVEIESNVTDFMRSSEWGIGVDRAVGIDTDGALILYPNRREKPDKKPAPPDIATIGKPRKFQLEE